MVKLRLRLNLKYSGKSKRKFHSRNDSHDKRSRLKMNMEWRIKGIQGCKVIKINLSHSYTAEPEKWITHEAAYLTLSTLAPNFASEKT